VPIESPWTSWLNAEVYHRFVREHSIYGELNRRLVELAEIATARRVLDLACGAGATALACLRRLPARAELVGVDASEAMVEMARGQIRDPRARFRVAAAAALETVVRGPFDRAVSNAAFWQFPAPRPVLASLGHLLAPGARLVFNVPAERVEGEAAPMHPFQAALARAIESEAGRRFGLTASRLDPRLLCELLAEAGFDLAGQERFVYRGRQGELMELMEIPAMIGPLTPELSDDTRRAVLDRAREHIDPEEPVEVPWIYFIARRREG
jgi:trans-aconitate methyltransferase